MEDKILKWCESNSKFSDDISQVVRDIIGPSTFSLDHFASSLAEIVKNETVCFLEPPTTPRSSLSERSISSPVAVKAASTAQFDDEFPSLSAPAPVIQKKKKRIRSTLISNTTTSTSSQRTTIGNIASIPDSMPVDSVILPKGLSNSLSSSNRSAFQLNSSSSFGDISGPTTQSMPPPSSPLKTRTLSEPMASPISPRSHLSHQKLTLDEATSAMIDTMDMTGKPTLLKRLARLYGNLILNQLMNRLNELNFLYRLLCCAHATIVAGSSPLVDAKSNFFLSPLDCLVFVTCVFEVAFPFVRELDPRVQSMLVNDPIFSSLCPDLTTNMISNVAKKRASLNSTHRVRVGKVSGSHSRGVALPFREETDSIHHFKSQEQSRLFVNREACRDSFLKLLRTHREVRREFDDKKGTKFNEEFPSEVELVLKLLLPANMQWFASLMVDHLAAASLDVENDEEVLLAGIDAKKLENLSQRMSSKPLSASHRVVGGGSNSNTNRKQPDYKSHTSSFSLNHLLGDPSELFISSGESFFFKFLSLVNDHHLLQHIHGLLVLRLTKSTEAWLSKKTASGDQKAAVSGLDPCRLYEGIDDDDTIDTLVSLRVFARFLGWLSFRCYWDLTGIAAQAQSLALDTALKDATKVETALSSPPPLKPRALLAQAREENILVLVVPWLVEYLRLLKWDAVIRKTSYFESLISELKCIHHQLLSMALNDNLTLVSIELELLFADLELLAPLPVVSSKVDLKPKFEFKGIDKFSLVAQRIYSRHLCIGVEAFFNGLLTSRKAFQSASTSIAKKVRPHFISSYDRMSMEEKVVQSRQSLGGSMLSSPLSMSMMRSMAVDNESSDLQRQMQVSFFQRYPELQSIADFVVNIALRNCGDLALKQLEVTELTVWCSEGSRGALRLANQLARLVIEAHMPKVVSETMSLLSPPNLPPQVKSVAIKLTLQQVKSVGVSVVVDVILPSVRQSLSRVSLNPTSISSSTLAELGGNASNPNASLPMKTKAYLPVAPLDTVISMLSLHSPKHEVSKPSSYKSVDSFINSSLSETVKYILEDGTGQVNSGGTTAPLLDEILPAALHAMFHDFYGKGSKLASSVVVGISKQVLADDVLMSVSQSSQSQRVRFFNLCIQLVHYRFIEPFYLERILLRILQGGDSNGGMKHMANHFGKHVINSFCSAMPLEPLHLHFHHLETLLDDEI